MPVPETIYHNDVDFTELALQYPDFSKRLKSNRQLDFSDPESVRQLTKALLRRDFQLTIDLPDDRLCPPVPNRFNYILFAQNLVDSTQPNYAESPSTSGTLVGLDIGTGASAIYPLLACRQRSTWAFLATEIDPKSRQYAQKNLVANNLQSRIKILNTDLKGEVLLPTSEFQDFENGFIRVQICNPPFYSSEAEMIDSARKKARPPNSACTGSPTEMIVDGGEVRFVSRLMTESAQFDNKKKIQWFSSMLGKLGSVSELVGFVRQLGCTNYVVTEFVQGQKTRRWCIAWSWFGLRPPTTLARGISSLDKKFFPFPTDFEFEVQGVNLSLVGRRVDTEITRVALLQWKCSKDFLGGTGRSMTGDVWSRRARRKKQEDQEMKDDSDSYSDSSTDVQEPQLVFRVAVKSIPPASVPTTALVHIRWLQGHEAVLFESFCGWLKRKVQARRDEAT